jgi:hypothetical protein
LLDYAADMAQARRVGEWARDTRATVKALCRANAMVAPAPAFRFLLSSFLLIQPLPVPYRVVGDVDEGAEWLNATLSAGAPAGMKEYLREQMALEISRLR